jgi:hypothetical protein
MSRRELERVQALARVRSRQLRVADAARLADASGGTLGVGGWIEGRCRNVAALDAGGGFVESRAEEEAAPSPA